MSLLPSDVAVVGVRCHLGESWRRSGRAGERRDGSGGAQGNLPRNRRRRLDRQHQLADGRAARGLVRGRGGRGRSRHEAPPRRLGRECAEDRRQRVDRVAPGRARVAVPPAMAGDCRKQPVDRACPVGVGRAGRPGNPGAPGQLVDGLDTGRAGRSGESWRVLARRQCTDRPHSPRVGQADQPWQSDTRQQRAERADSTGIGRPHRPH